jgi:hypothetical protein
MPKRRDSSPLTGKPGPELKSLRSFWRLLGWSELNFGRHKITDPPEGHSFDPFVTWYESGDLDDIYLQINHSPVWCAAVYALRYRIFSRWHSFKLSSDPKVQSREAKRLSPWLEHRWFVDRDSRREYRGVHPECDRWSWERIRESGVHFDLMKP